LKKERKHRRIGLNTPQNGPILGGYNTEIAKKIYLKEMRI
jgi:hypothetical protein